MPRPPPPPFAEQSPRHRAPTRIHIPERRPATPAANTATAATPRQPARQPLRRHKHRNQPADHHPERQEREPPGRTPHRTPCPRSTTPHCRRPHSATSSPTRRTPTECIPALRSTRRAVRAQTSASPPSHYVSALHRTGTCRTAPFPDIWKRSRPDGWPQTTRRSPGAGPRRQRDARQRWFLRWYETDIAWKAATLCCEPQ